jgi:hypothetical protein
MKGQCQKLPEGAQWLSSASKKASKRRQQTISHMVGHHDKGMQCYCCMSQRTTRMQKILLLLCKPIIGTDARAAWQSRPCLVAQLQPTTSQHRTKLVSVTFPQASHADYRGPLKVMTAAISTIRLKAAREGPAITPKLQGGQAESL